MAIKSNITDRRSRREKYKKEITLISGGFAKPEAFPDGKITVYPWDSATDAWLTEAATKASGPERDRLLYDLMARVCNLNGCPLEDFVLGDVNAVLMTARSIANQNRIQYLTLCPKCGHEEVAEIQVPEELKPVAQKPTDYVGHDTVTLDESKEVVDVRPLRIRDEIMITGRSAQERERVSNHIAHIIAPVVTINSTQADRIEELMEWYESLPPHDSKQLEVFIEDSTPHLSQELPHKCEECGNLWAHRLVLDQEFFRSGRMGTAGRALAANL
jgi:DNA-directed RNA polymerase subunit M/transcription elongation factor TFIIS